jgi:hypothetical protein
MVLTSFAELHDRGADSPPGLKLDAKSPKRVGKDAFEDPHPLGSGTFKKVETGHADTFELKQDDAGQPYLRDRLKASGTILIIAMPDDEEVAAHRFRDWGQGGRELAAIERRCRSCKVTRLRGKPIADIRSV